MSKPIKLSIEEIARRLYKKGWADLKEHKQALDALERLSYQETLELERIAATRYDNK